MAPAIRTNITQRRNILRLRTPPPFGPILHNDATPCVSKWPPPFGPILHNDATPCVSEWPPPFGPILYNDATPCVSEWPPPFGPILHNDATPCVSERPRHSDRCYIMTQHLASSNGPRHSDPAGEPQLKARAKPPAFDPPLSFLDLPRVRDGRCCLNEMEGRITFAPQWRECRTARPGR